MPDFILDCNHLSNAIRKHSVLRDRIRLERRTDRRFVTIMPILCELQAGIQQTSHPADNQLRLTQLLRLVRVWPVDLETAEIYGASHIELRRKGRVLSQVDMMIAALARQHKLVVLTTDQDFEALTDLRLENWVE